MLILFWGFLIILIVMGPKIRLRALELVASPHGSLEPSICRLREWDNQAMPQTDFNGTAGPWITVRRKTFAN